MRVLALLAPDVAMMHSQFRIYGDIDEPERTGIGTRVLPKIDGDWRTVAVQNTDVHGRGTYIPFHSTEMGSRNILCPLLAPSATSGDVRSAGATAYPQTDSRDLRRDEILCAYAVAIAALEIASASR